MPFDPAKECSPAIIRAMLQVASLDWRSEPRPRHKLVEEAAARPGRFDPKEPTVTFLEQGRKVRLESKFDFIHEDWEPWPVPPGTIVDGASIPQPFWSVIGGPFEGRYRNASIVHDYYCDHKVRPWRDVHRMFYEGMLSGGVGAAKAKIMYYAVYRFGPRWRLPTESKESALVQATPELTESAAESFARDAEAIHMHDLDLREIEALADARNDEAPAVTTEGFESPVAALERAKRLVVMGGSGSRQDHEVVALQAASLPDYVLARFEKKGIRIIACRGNVTDFESDLLTKVPRGWELTNKTWRDVPGAYFPDRKRVVIATIDQDGSRFVPTKSSRLHGSEDLVVHEALHGYDYVGGHAVLGDQRFVRARRDDLEALSVYERQDGQAGLEETFAESGARFAVHPDVMAASLPSLCRYWQAGPLDSELLEGVSLEPTIRADAPIGTAVLNADGSIELDLRAEGPGGAIGHAWFTVSTDDPFHASLKARLVGEEGLETADGKEVLVFP